MYLPPINCWQCPTRSLTWGYYLFGDICPRSLDSGEVGQSSCGQPSCYIQFSLDSRTCAWVVHFIVPGSTGGCVHFLEDFSPLLVCRIPTFPAELSRSGVSKWRPATAWGPRGLCFSPGYFSNVIYFNNISLFKTCKKKHFTLKDVFESSFTYVLIVAEIWVIVRHRIVWETHELFTGVDDRGSVHTGFVHPLRGLTKKYWCNTW